MADKRYFEYRQGSSNKFWEVWCKGTEVFTRYGKIGANGQLTVKDLGAAGAAKVARDKLIDEKTGKGYVERGATSKQTKPEPVAGDGLAYVDVPAGVVRLELVLKTVRRYLQLQRDGKTVIVTEGEVGEAKPPKPKRVKTKDEWEARGEYNKLLAEAQRKGFTYVLSGKAPKRPAVAARDATQEAQLANDPGDDALAVYADWLQERGDVRGELAALQMKSAKDKKLAKAADKLLWDYRGYFYGPLAPYLRNTKPERRSDTAIEAVWRAGWIDTLALGAINVWMDSATPIPRDAATLIRLLPEVASARFVRDFTITRPTGDGEYSFATAVEALVKAMPALPSLRRLTLGRFTAGDSELSWSYMGPLARLWPVAKQLEYVKIRAGSMSLGKIDLPECREFLVETGGLDRASLKSIINARFPKLERLSVWFGQENYGADCKPKDVAPILDGKGLGKVKHLGLKNWEFGNELLPLLAKAKILRQLETLDISMSHITTDVLERELVPHKAAFAHLDLLDLSRCLLDAKGRKLAKSLAKQVNVEDQDGDGEEYAADGYRYSAVGE